MPEFAGSRRRIIAVALAVSLVGAVGGLWALTGALSAPAPARAGPAPRELDATSVRIPLPHGGDVAGWIARGTPGRGAVLLLHPLRGSRHSMVDRAQFLRRAGYTVLLVDLPAHGESPGDRITFGARESVGARAALAYLRQQAPGERVGAVGVSLGGASLLLGAGEPAANHADAVVLEAVYPTIDEAVADRMRIRVGPAGPFLAPLLTLQLRPRLGITANELRPIDRIGALRVPVWIVAGEADRHTPLAESRRLFAAAPDPKAWWMVPGAPHGDFHAAAPVEYERRLLAFLSRHLQTSP